MNLDEATKLALQTDYAVGAVGPAELNTADAGAFFLEGYLYAEKVHAKTIERRPMHMKKMRSDKKPTDEQIKTVWDNMPAEDKDPLVAEFGELQSAALFYAHAKIHGFKLGVLTEILNG